MPSSNEESLSGGGIPISIGVARTDDADAVRNRVALVAIHGMGQQLPFETIDDALEGIYGPQTTAKVTRVEATFVASRLDPDSKEHPDLEPRLRLDVTARDAAGHDTTVGVDVYEVHWSDFTSKAATALETYWFLVTSACSGVAFKITPNRLMKPYVRWVNGVEMQPVIPTWHVVMLCLAMFDVLALGVIGVLFFAVTAYRATDIVLALNAIEHLLLPMQSIVNLFFAIEGVSGFILMIAAFLEKQQPHRATTIAGLRQSATNVTSPRWLVRWIATLFGWIFFLGPILTLLAVIGMTVWQGWFPGAFLTGQPSVEIAVWFAGLGVYLVVQHFLTEFVGDVVIYMSAHRVSRFHAIRDRIREQAERTVTSIIDREYHHVVIAAHSLGSVIAYDTLNSIFLDQLATTGTSSAGKVDLVTYGSPLRKRAFLMRKFGSESRIRSALLGSAQPIIAFASDECGTCKLNSWTNVWSKQDWISGELTADTFGFAPDGVVGTYRNVRETDLAVPLISHLNYMSGREVPQAILRAILR